MKVAVIGSGPSLHADDVSLIQEAGIFTIAVNSAWKHARFCDVIFAGDGSWWEKNADDIDIKAEGWCCRDQGQLFGTQYFKGMSGWNSGANAIWFALQEKKASSILITGFDCSLRHGTHVHGDHPNTYNPVASDVQRWHGEFQRVAGMAKAAGVPLLNCSRYTEITTIQRVDLAQALGCSPALITKSSALKK